MQKSEKKQKAYKLLAVQMGLSNSKAKELIDRGVVYVGNRKVAIARGELPIETRFRVLKLERPEVIFENEEVLALNKPAFYTSDEAAAAYRSARLLHRLDRETSGVLLLSKNRSFHKRAEEAFRARAVYKVYTCWVQGMVSEPATWFGPVMWQSMNVTTKPPGSGKACTLGDKPSNQSLLAASPPAYCAPNPTLVI